MKLHIDKQQMNLVRVKGHPLEVPFSDSIHDPSVVWGACAYACAYDLLC